MVFAGCSKWEESPVVSQLKIVNAYPATGNISIRINNSPDTTLNFGDASRYIQQRSGKSSMQVRTSASATVSVDLFLAENRSYSAYILKTISNNDTLFVRIDTLTVPGIGRSRIRFANLSPGSDTLKLAVSLVVSGPLALSIPAQRFTRFTPFITIDAGQGYIFTLQKNSVPVASLGPVRLDSERIYTILAMGYTDRQPGTPGALMLNLISNR
jgi:hypothetical protein